LQSVNVKELDNPDKVVGLGRRGGRIPDFYQAVPKKMTIRIVLVGTTHPGNIGAVARAMKNMGLDDLALVNPRHFPHDDAIARASGATDVLDTAKVVSSLSEALTDCVYVAGASARSRTINWPSMGPRDCAERMMLEGKEGVVAAVFGPENSGLNNDDLDLCHTLLTMTYELRVASRVDGGPGFESESPPATGDEMEHFYSHLERVLTDIQFLDPDNPRLLMRRMRRMFIRARPDKSEVNILRGFLSAVDRTREKE